MTRVQTYDERCAQVFEPTSVKYSELQSVVPAHLRKKSFVWAVSYAIRDIAFSWLFYRLALHIDSNELIARLPGSRWIAWSAYWFFQSVVWTGMWAIGQWLVYSSCRTQEFKLTKTLRYHL